VHEADVALVVAAELRAAAGPVVEAQRAVEQLAGGSQLASHEVDQAQLVHGVRGSVAVRRLLEQAQRLLRVAGRGRPMGLRPVRAVVVHRLDQLDGALQGRRRTGARQRLRLLHVVEDRRHRPAILVEPVPVVDARELQVQPDAIRGGRTLGR
jgi:hypothetical protein